MALPREMFHPSSPPSEGGADSYNNEGTPDTRLTTFSPLEDSSKSSRLLSALSLSSGKTNAEPIKFQVPTSFHRVPSPRPCSSKGLDKDPFISSTPEKSQTKLSATASAFRPITASAVSTPIVAYGSSSGTPKPLTQSFTAETRYPNTGLKLASGLSHTLNLTRSLRISSSSGSVSISAVEQYLEKIKSNGSLFRGQITSLVQDRQDVYIRVTNIRDSAKVLDGTEDMLKDWKIECVSAEEINKACGIDIATKNEGQHAIIVVPTADLGDSQIEANIVAYFRHFDIFALEGQSALTTGVLRWVLEFDEIDLTWTLGFMKQGWINVGGLFWMFMSPYVPGNENTEVMDGFNQFPPSMEPSTGLSDNATGLGSMSLAGFQQAMPIGASMVPSTMPFGSSHSLLPKFHTSWTQYSRSFELELYHNEPNELRFVYDDTVFFASFAKLSHNATRISRGYFSPPGPHHNHVDIQKIREGTDVRTTIMLRNIPNKVDQQMLKAIIDDSSWGKYDFMYLRIDFANDCNVGYAFINFVDPLDIIDFANARGNQRWNCFKSDKVAEISYATIQGKDCLVQKFRNSSLYYTINGPAPEMSGQEEPFPEPDNQSKMKRSCENAEHVGLFTPNAGQHFRDEQRRRRSQYDRGTRLAALEECSEFDMYPQELVL
ncbi:hypothetical protein VPNG_03848 [Cytospora leucostoma]|uniref:RRM domain-containing protein n=1 Tax=Cytospora leucostoma TaxID=1230097 RepID=A0A423XE85_9PEZI|nr:hypothetical protein VPNG_03848 [Cytospora leucostoma]